jgi:hypothetical protein
MAVAMGGFERTKLKGDCFVAIETKTKIEEKLDER